MTREGGYEYKKLAASFQGITLGEKGHDCGTKLTKKLLVSGDVAGMILYRYIVENGKLVKLTPENIDKYKNKYVNLRTPLYCKDDKYCNICSGDLYYMMDNLENVGLIINRVGTSLLNASLKAFHDLSLKVMHPNINDYIH